MKLLYGSLISLLFATTLQAADFTHPAGAWKITLPAGWQVGSRIDPRGYPVHIVTPEKPDEVDHIRKGIWIFAVPIPTDESLEGSSVASLVSQLLISGEPDLKATNLPDVKANLGKLNVSSLDITGRRTASGPWRGRMLVAIEEEQFIVVMYGAAPADWNEFQPIAEKALTTFEGTQKSAPRAEPARPAQPERLSDVADRLKPAIPLLHVLVSNPKEPDNFKSISWGSGFIITEDGYLITNRHVVDKESHGELQRESFDPINVDWDITLKRKTRIADVVAISYREDLALLKIRSDPGEKFSVIPLADSRKARRGDAVAVLGWPNPNALGESDLNANQGTLAAIEHDSRGRVTAIRHSARTTGGNSGGPLYDLELGGVIAVHNISVTSRRDDVAETLTFKGVPSDWIVREFPQVASASSNEKLTIDERHALMAYYFLQNRFGAATIEAKEVLSDYPADGIAAAYLARMETLLGAPSGAKGLTKLALNDPASESLASLLGARTAYEVDDFKTALELANRAVRVAPNNPDAHVILGHVHAGMFHFDQARKEYQSALSLSSDLNPEAHAALGAAAINEWISKNEIIALPPSITPSGDMISHARASLNKSLELWPANNAMSHAFLALASALEGKNADVVPRLNRALAVGKNDPDAILAVAYVLLLQGQFEAASDKVAAAMKIRSSPHAIFFDGWANLELAAALAKAGKTDDAAKYANLGAKEYLIAAKSAPDAGWAPVAQKFGQALYKPQ